jgi:hypothetical protein
MQQKYKLLADTLTQKCIVLWLILLVIFAVLFKRYAYPVYPLLPQNRCLITCYN